MNKLQPYDEYKDSGIEWLGEIPAHWEVRRFKEITKLIIDGTHHTPDYTDEDINFLSVNDITKEAFDLSKSKKISIEEHNRLIRRCKPQKGDILLSKNGTIGVPFIIEFDTPISIYVSLCLIKLKRTIYNKFFYYLLHSELMFEQYRINSKTNSVSNLHLDKLKDFISLVPPFSEQILTAKYLDQKTTQIDAIIENVKLQVDTLQELRKTLINDVVTGKVKVYS